MSRPPIALALASLLTACARPAPAQPPATGSAPPPTTPTARDAVGAEVLAAMDATVDPCVDFYRHACGGWLANTPRPPHQSAYGRWSELTERNDLVLRDILEDAARGDGDPRLGTVWRACIDEAAHERAGVTPIAPELAKIERVKDEASLWQVLGELHRDLFLGSGPLFNLIPVADARDPDRWVMTMLQGGTGLPGREFYVAPGHAALRAEYRRHVAQMLGFLGAAPAAAQAQAARVVAFEGELAAHMMSPADLRDVTKTYNPVGVAGLQALDRATPWPRYFAALGYPNFGADLQLTTPGFFAALGPLVRRTDAATLRAYLRWHTVHAMAAYLSPAIVEADFAFTRALTGAQSLAPRWQRCVDEINANLGTLVGQAFVARQFAGASKATAAAMIDRVQQAFAAGLPTLAWMDPDTRARALEKLGAVDDQIGHPARWRDFSGLKVTEGEHLRNVTALYRFELVHYYDRIGGPVDRSEWQLPPAMVNAIYDRGGNAMLFAAGVLQPPYFGVDRPMALNFGGIGTVMGHELVHGFDDSGRRFDGRGVLREWWSPAAVQRFTARTACVEAAYGEIEVLPGLKLDSKQTLGENIADLGGLKVAHAAWRAWRRERPAPPAIDGLDDDQLFFLGYAQVWCTHITDETLRLIVATDFHSPPEQRVNVPLAHLPAFWDAYRCEPGAPMRAGPDACEVW